MSNAAVSERMEEPRVGAGPLGQRILIIDDEAGIRDSLEDLVDAGGLPRRYGGRWQLGTGPALAP